MIVVGLAAVALVVLVPLLITKSLMRRVEKKVWGPEVAAERRYDEIMAKRTGRDFADIQKDRRNAEAEERWRQANAENKAAGCKCGKPATQVRYDNRNIGSVPVEFWTCDEHVGVNAWTRSGSGPWIPTESIMRRHDG